LSGDATTVIVLPEIIDVKSIHIAFQKLEDAFARASGTGLSLAIDLRQVVDADVTLVQLVESARRTAAQSGVALRLCEPAQGPVLQTLQRGGFLTDPPDARTRFWRGE
jgi:anti-anti-sigma regulatory factor